MDRAIRVKVVVDEAFRNSFWVYDIQEELDRVSLEFQRQFGVGLIVTGISEWHSIGSGHLKDYPFNIIRRMPRGVSPEDVIGYLLRSLTQWMRLPVDFSQEEREELHRVLTQEPLLYQLGFFKARLEVVLKECLVVDLQAKILKDDNDLVLGFSGKMILPMFNGLIGAAKPDYGYALIFFCFKPAYTILHEIGHCFGAKHAGNKSSVMHDETTKWTTSNFDQKNRAIILACLKDKKLLN